MTVTWLVKAAVIAAVVGSVCFLTPAVAFADDSQWIRPSKPGDPLIWGRKDGIVFGLPSVGGLPGPRGLIRVGVFSPKTGASELLNYIAVEPVVRGRRSRGDRMAFSELEPSQLDAGLSGKRLWVGSDASSAYAGDLTASSSERQHSLKLETLTVRIEVESFQTNGAHVFVVASIRSDHPQEVRMAVYRHDDSPEIEELTLSATMGNYERLRWLWLKDRVVDSRKLYGSYRGDEFAERGTYSLGKMLRNENGDAIVFCTSNEAHPDTNPDFTAKEHWRYGLGRLTQYWMVPATDIESNLRVRVDGRRVYWNSHAPIGGGIAFENFEVRQKYRPGQVFIFGAVPIEPWQIRPAIQHLAAQRALESN